MIEALAVIGICTASLVAAAFIDGANEDKNREKRDKMTSEQQDLDDKFWDRMMQ